MKMEDMEFHHTGLATRDIDAEAEHLGLLGYQQEGDDFVDLRQGVRGRFMVGGGPRLELLQPYGDGKSVLDGWLSRGVKLYHLAYETADLAVTVSSLEAEGAKLIVPPVPAVAFDNRKICFLMLPNMLLIELIARI